MPTSGRDNIIGKLKREPVANVTPDAVIGKVKHWKALFRFPDESGVIGAVGIMSTRLEEVLAAKIADADNGI